MNNPYLDWTIHKEQFFNLAFQPPVSCSMSNVE